MGGLSNLPPGTPTGWQRSTITVICQNQDCEEYMIPAEVEGVYERDTGGSWIEPEEDAYCPVCGRDRVG